LHDPAGFRRAGFYVLRGAAILLAAPRKPRILIAG